MRPGRPRKPKEPNREWREHPQMRQQRVMGIGVSRGVHALSRGEDCSPAQVGRLVLPDLLNI